MGNETKQQIQDSWQQLRDAVSVEQNVSALTLVVYLLVGGAMALYVRLLYRKFGASPSDAESITRVFPLLTLVTIGVISVVKSSMALSLGLVGALSIVSFRTAIKEPEELVYLFLCIGIGLGLGAGQPLLALSLVLVATVYILGMHAVGKGRCELSLMLTISGAAERFSGSAEAGVLQIIEKTCGPYTLQRFDIEGTRGQIRIGIKQTNPSETAGMIARLREQLPDCELSFVNLSSLV